MLQAGHPVSYGLNLDSVLPKEPLGDDHEGTRELALQELVDQEPRD